MDKLDIRQILASNLKTIKKQRGFTQAQMAEVCGISQSHLSEILAKITKVSVDLLNEMAHGLRMQPWELLAESETAKKAALAKLLWGGNVTNEKVEEHFPLPPASSKEGTPKIKKPGRKPPQSGGRSHPGARS